MPLTTVPEALFSKDGKFHEDDDHVCSVFTGVLPLPSTVPGVKQLFGNKKRRPGAEKREGGIP